MAQPFVSVKGRGAVGGMLGGQNKIRERVKLNSSVFLLLFTTVNNANRHTHSPYALMYTPSHTLRQIQMKEKEKVHRLLIISIFSAQHRRAEESIIY